MQQLSYLPAGTLLANPWDHVELSEQEQYMALDEAKQKKYWKLQEEDKQRRQEAFWRNIKAPWTAGELKSYLYDRAKQLKSELIIDNENERIIDLLCLYFTNDISFESQTPRGITQYSLNKGILFFGDVGIGKTFLMRLFSRNKRQCFDIINCQQLASMFARDGDTAINTFSNIRYEPKDPRYFLHQDIGQCFDDLGTEEEKQYFGNKTNVMAEIILNRYHKRHEFGWDKTHITTNNTMTELEQMYGTRVWSRMNEMFNMIQFNGNDRRRK